MSYTPNLIADAGVLIGNPTGLPALPDNVPIDATLTLSGTKLSAVVPNADTTTGHYTVQATDHQKIKTSTDATAKNYTLPAGLRQGLRLRSHQGGNGQISYIAGAGATIVNMVAPKSGGKPEDNYFADILNLGSDAWIVFGNLA